MTNYYAPYTETITTTFYQNNVLTDPSSVTATVKNPDGSFTTVTPTSSTTGIWLTKIQMTQAGLYEVKITGTTSGDNVTTYYQFEVERTGFDW